MADDNDEDEDQVEETGDDRPDAPNAPDTPNAQAPQDLDPKAMLYQNLMLQAQARQGLQDARQGFSDDMARNQLYASLAQSSAQAGSIGGKIASAAPVQGMAQGLDQANAADVQGLKDQAQEQDKDRDALMRFLQQKTIDEISKQRAKDQADKNAETARHHAVDEQNTSDKNDADAQAKADSRDKSKFVPMGADKDGNLLIMDNTTGQVVNTGQQGQKIAGAPGSGGKNDPYTEMQMKQLTARGNPSVQKAQQALVNINGAEDLIAQYPNVNNMPKEQVALLSKEIEKVATGGGGTEGGARSIVAETFESNWKNLLSRVGNNPQGADLGAFINENKIYLQNLKNVYQKVDDNYHLSVYNAYKHKLTPEQDAEYKGANSDLFGRVGANPQVATSSIGMPAAASGTAIAAPATSVLSKLPPGATQEDVNAALRARGYKIPGAQPIAPSPGPAPAGFSGPPPGGP